MKKMTKILAAVLVVSTVLSGVTAFAEEAAKTSDSAIAFSDMPNDWTTKALENAVENGLLKGDNGKIMPYDNITRAQMAAIVVRAFGADTPANISIYSDVTTDKWYYEEFAKAVYMNAFKGTNEGKLNPESFITFQECFTVVARIFNLPKNVDVACLDKFEDGKDVAEWAKEDFARVVANGYWEGVDGKLKPTEYITRSEFAVLMDNLVKMYINKPGTYTEFVDGNILIRSENVVISGLETDDLIIVGDGVHGVTKLDVVSTNDIICRGGDVKIFGTVHNISGMISGINIDLSGVKKRTGLLYLAVKGIDLNFGTVVVGP